MAKRKRLGPARLEGPTPTEPRVPSPARAALGGRPPIADVAQDAAATAALSEIAQELSSARTEGRLIQRLPLDAVDPAYLVRDRAALDEDEMQVLCDSLAARGQQTPDEVTETAPGRYGLISGFRRYKALQRLNQSEILAILRRPAEAAEAYQAMVEENEVRAGLSFYERGRIVARACDAGVYRTDRLALGALFSAVPRSRRSKIGAFVTLVRALDEVLTYPTHLSEKLGLGLAKRLAEDAGFAQRLAARLRDAPPADAAAEIAILTRALQPAPAETSPAAPALRDDVPPPPRPEPEALAEGLEMLRNADGSVTFRGARLAEDGFAARLADAAKALI